MFEATSVKKDAEKVSGANKIRNRLIGNRPVT